MHEKDVLKQVSQQEIEEAKRRMDAWVIPGKRKFGPRPNEIDLRRAKEEAKQETSEASSDPEKKPE